MDKWYLAIDLKSFFASVECVERGLNPLTTNLVVADPNRTEKTICLAVSPSLKAYGISGRARLFEVIQQVEQVNRQRLAHAPGQQFTGSSSHDPDVQSHPELKLDYIVAPPRMSYYMAYSSKVYQIYLRYVAPEDIHAYSIDEVFIDITPYLSTYRCTPHELAQRMIHHVLRATGITATAGIGTNLYLSKVAMDIVAKHTEPDAQGVRMAELDEGRYRELLWNHQPITDFWRVGRGYARRLDSVGIHTMGDIARCSVSPPETYPNRELLYKLFGVNARFLIDHAWGWEPCTIADIKAYRPRTKSLSSGQVLQTPYPSQQARLVTQEMTDSLALELVSKALVTSQLTLTIGYDIENLQRSDISYSGPVVTDGYGRRIPKHAHGTVNLKPATASGRALCREVLALFDRITTPALLVRRITLSANRLLPESQAAVSEPFQQLDLFAEESAQSREASGQEKERSVQNTILTLRKRYGKNTVLKGMNFKKGATAIARNGQIGGHKA